MSQQGTATGWADPAEIAMAQAEGGKRPMESYYTTVRVLRRATGLRGNIERGLVRAEGCERFESFAAFSISSFPAKLSGCTSENLSSLSSRT